MKLKFISVFLALFALAACSKPAETTTTQTQQQADAEKNMMKFERVPMPTNK